MDIDGHDVERHYGRGQILESIMRALGDMQKDVSKLSPADLALVDEFHTRGRAATIELARRAALTPGLNVLDVGCGLGGSARYLASEHGCRVTGIDLTKEYVDAATALAELVGMKDLVTFHQASALDLPFPDGSFDAVWTQHVQMNIADKRGFYGQITRVLAPRGRLLFHDVFQGPGGALHYPVPWAEDGSISFLETPETVRKILEGLGFSVLAWDDKSQMSREWFVTRLAALDASGPPPLGSHLLMGATARLKLENNARNLSEQRSVVVQGVLEKA
jgi:sarcosine/dimethylglycine N-methyltransferase